MEIIRVNKYHPHSRPESSKNPFISVFPEIDDAKINKLIQRRIEFSAELREHSHYQRLVYVDDIFDWFFPLEQQTNFTAAVWRLIVRGYRARNPSEDSAQSKFERLMSQIEKGDIVASDASILDNLMTGTLIGTPGSGKTTSVLALLKQLSPGLFHHHVHGDLYQLLYIHVTATSASKRSLAEEIYGQLRSALKNVKGPKPFASPKAPRTTAEFIAACKTLGRNLNVGLIVVDEVQHLFRANGNPDKDAMIFLTTLVNELKIPVLLVGTWEAVPLLGMEVRLGRRTTSPATAFFRRMENDETWQVFLQALFKYQYVKEPLKSVPSEIADIIYQHTQGIQDLVIKLFVATQIEAIRQGYLASIDPDPEVSSNAGAYETITAELIDSVATKHFKIIEPAIRQLREGTRRENDPMLWDNEPEKLSTYLQTYLAKAKIALALKKTDADLRAESLQNKEDRVKYALVETGLTDEPNAEIIAAAAVKQSPQLSPAEITAKIIQEATPAGPRPTKAKTSKKQQAIDAEFAALADNDVRKIKYLADKSGADLESALTKALHLCELPRHGL